MKYLVFILLMINLGAFVLLASYLVLLNVPHRQTIEEFMNE